MGNKDGEVKFKDMTKENKKERITKLWVKARRYNNKLRL